jgi:NADPH:quinone reductase-like Zn-dependent oxidoreductase
VNPVDWKIRSGQIPAFAATMPYTPGYDVSGVVETLGDGVTDFKVGDEVYAYMALNRGGGYAQFAALPASEAAKKPASMHHVQAAAVPLAALTAWQALFDTAKLQPGQTVLIHGAAGGVGHFAVQLAHAKGAKVIATASERNIDFVKTLGADQVIDYKAQKFEEVVKDVDVVFDTVGGETTDRSIGTLKAGGIIVSITGMPDQARCKEKGVRGTAILVKTSGKQLAELAAMIEAGTLAPTVGSTMFLADAAQAQELSESGKTPRGKIVLIVE